MRCKRRLRLRRQGLHAMDTNTSERREMSTETEKPSARVGQLAADLMARYFDEVGSEVLERQRGGGVDRILPSPEVGTPNVTARSGY